MNIHQVPRVVCAAFAFLLLPLASLAQSAGPRTPEAVAVVRSILDQSEDKIDLTQAKLTFDRMVYPTPPTATTTAHIDSMAGIIRAMLPANATNADKVAALRKYIYTAGAWNGNKPFHYNFDDPDGESLEGSIVARYIETKKGQCISMPLLFIFLAERLKLPVAIAKAPNHTFVMVQGENGSWTNLETTSDGGPASLATIQRQAPMTQTAIDNGVYMRPLGKRETVAAMAEVLLHSYRDKKQPEAVIALSELL